jgi:hypothetical protein
MKKKGKPAVSETILSVKNYRLTLECRKNRKLANDYLTLTSIYSDLLISDDWCILIITITFFTKQEEEYTRPLQNHAAQEGLTIGGF